MCRLLYDYLSAYDGESISSKQIFRLSGSYNMEENLGEIFSTGSQMTLNFSTDGFDIYSGFDLTVKVVNDEILKTEFDITCAQAQGGKVVASAEKAVYGTRVTLTAEPEEGYVFQSLEAVRGNGKTVPVTNANWYYDSINSGKSTYFKMPLDTVTVTPVFVPEGSQHINMRTYDEFTTAVIPDNVKQFRLYDDGGEEKDYTVDKLSALTISGSQNTVLKLTGTITAAISSNFDVFDGTNHNNLRLYHGVFSTDGETVDIGTIFSNSESIYTEFYAGYNSYSGLDITVTVCDKSTKYDVIADECENGTVTASKTKAGVGETVTVKCEPNSGYYLKEVIVTSESGKKINLNGIVNNSNTYKFTMPDENVNVSAVFDNNLDNLSLIVPKTGTDSFTIPQGVTSLKVYDHGGKDGEYDNYCDGDLVLTAPAGYIFELSGSFYTESCDYINVYARSQQVTALSGYNDNLTPLVVPSNVMTINFYTDYSVIYPGFELIVTIK